MVTLPAEIDISNEAMVRDLLARARDTGPAVIIADATLTTFCARTGVGLLIEAHHRAAAAGGQLRVVVSTAGLRRIVELTCADQELRIYPSLAAALSGGAEERAGLPASEL